LIPNHSFNYFSNEECLSTFQQRIPRTEAVTQDPVETRGFRHKLAMPSLRMLHVLGAEDIYFNGATPVSYQHGWKYFVQNAQMWLLLSHSYP
jgi:hypothetical protein